MERINELLTSDPLEGLARIEAARREVDDAERGLIEAARAQGHGWAAIAVQGAGSIAGGILAGRLSVHFGLLGCALFGIGMALWFLPWVPLMVAGSFIAGIGLPWTVVAAMSAVQLWTPHEMLGRVSASASTVIFAPIAFAIPAGAAFTADAGDHTTRVLCIAAVVIVASLVEVKRRLSQGEAPHPSRSSDLVSVEPGEPAAAYPSNALVPDGRAGADKRTASPTLP